MSNVSDNRSIEPLSIFTCLLIDLPESGIECATNQSDTCIKCIIRGGFMTQEKFSEYEGSTAQLVCLTIYVIAAVISSFGIFGNIVIVGIMRKKPSQKAFNFFITFLAWIDLYCCVMVIVTSTLIMACIGNWPGKEFLVGYYYIVYLVAHIGRSASTFTTIIITIERYLGISYPLRSRIWFTKRKAKLLCAVAIIISILIFIPRITTFYGTRNIYNEEAVDIPSLRNAKYIIRLSTWEPFWYGTLGGVHNLLDYLLPFPILMLFNLLSFYEVHKAMKRRKDMNVEERKEVQAVKMFLPVVIVLLICSIVPTVSTFGIHLYGTVYREMALGIYLSIAINCSANFPIYYFGGTRFRKDTKNLLTCPIFWKSYRSSAKSTRSSNVNASRSSTNADSIQETSVSR